MAFGPLGVVELVAVDARRDMVAWMGAEGETACGDSDADEVDEGSRSEPVEIVDRACGLDGEAGANILLNTFLALFRIDYRRRNNSHSQLACHQKPLTRMGRPC